MKAVLTFACVNADGSTAKPEVQRRWADLTKQDIEALETAMLSAQLKLLEFGKALNAGTAVDPGNTNPVTFVSTFTVTENDVLWFHSKFVWPKTGDEPQAMIVGLLDGALDAIRSATPGLSAKAVA